MTKTHTEIMEAMNGLRKATEARGVLVDHVTTERTMTQYDSLPSLDRYRLFVQTQLGHISEYVQLDGPSPDEMIDYTINIDFPARIDKLIIADTSILVVSEESAEDDIMNAIADRLEWDESVPGALEIVTEKIRVRTVTDSADIPVIISGCRKHDRCEACDDGYTENHQDEYHWQARLVGFDGDSVDIVKGRIYTYEIVEAK